MKVITRLTLIIGLIFVGVFIGCSTIMHGASQEIGISSVPSGAKVTIDDGYLGMTPVVAKLKRKDTHEVVISKAGYMNFEMILVRKTSGWVWGNILFGGIIGLGIDAIAGGMYKLTPEQVDAKLLESSTSYKVQEGNIYVFLIEDNKDDYELIGYMK